MDQVTSVAGSSGSSPTRVTRMASGLCSAIACRAATTSTAWQSSRSGECATQAKVSAPVTTRNDRAPLPSQARNRRGKSPSVEKRTARSSGSHTRFSRCVKVYSSGDERFNHWSTVLMQLGYAAHASSPFRACHPKTRPKAFQLSLR